MYNNNIRLAAAFSLLAFTNAARAQLYVDATGPRNLLFPTKEEKRPEGDKLTTKFDTENKSVTAGYFSMRDWAEKDSVGTNTVGFLTTLASANGLEELFKSHTLDLTALYNRTWATGRSEPWFVNISGGVRHDNLRIRTTSADPVRDARSDTGKGALGFGRQFGGGKYAFALTARYERTTNYEELKKVDVAGRPAREGILARSDATPVSVVLTHEFRAGFAADLIRRIKKESEAQYSFIGALYAEYDPTTKGLVDHRLGINVTVKELKVASGEALQKKRRELAKANKLPEDTFDAVSPLALAEISLPWSFFAEWKQPFGSKKAEFVTGAAVFFAWP